MYKKAHSIEYCSFRRSCFHSVLLREMLILVGFLFIIVKVTPSDHAKEESKKEDISKIENSPSNDGHDISGNLMQALQQPEKEVDPNWPDHLRLDPMFIEFPDLFTSPAMETGSIEHYKERRKAELDAIFDLGIQYRQEGNLEQSKKTFISLINKRPPVSYRKRSLLQLALIAEKNEDWIRANQIYSQFDSLYPDDSNLALVYLKMGDILRRTGGMEKALQKYHSVISMTMKMRGYKEEYLPVVQRLVVKAKVEIAETHFMDGDYENAARLYRRLLIQQHSNSDLVGINKPLVHYKLIYSYFLNEDFGKVEGESGRFLEAYGNTPKAIEVRYLFAKTLMMKNRRSEALRQFKEILENPTSLKESEPETWTRLQVRIGVEIGELMVKEGDLMAAVQIHESLLDLELEEKDLLEVLYQLGILHEDLKYTQKALAFYQRIIDRVSNLKSDNLSRHLQMIGEMAGWRIQTLTWLEAKESEMQRTEHEAQVSG